MPAASSAGLRLRIAADASGTTRITSTARANHACPKCDLITSPMSDGSAIEPRPLPAAYAAWKPMPKSAVASAAAHALTMSRRTRERSITAGQIARRNTAPPTRMSTPRNASVRIRPNVMPTARLPCDPASAEELTLCEGVPTEKVYAPWIGCESADTTR